MVPLLDEEGLDWLRYSRFQDVGYKCLAFGNSIRKNSSLAANFFKYPFEHCEFFMVTLVIMPKQDAFKIDWHRQARTIPYRGLFENRVLCRSKLNYWSNLNVCSINQIGNPFVFDSIIRLALQTVFKRLSVGHYPWFTMAQGLGPVSGQAAGPTS